jgi:hypothetical protein
VPNLDDSTDLHVYPLAKGSTAFSWFTSTPLVVHAGNYTVRDGKMKIRPWVRNPTAASVTLSAGLALAHYDLETVAGTVRLRAQLEPELSADEILSEMRFDNAACDEDELRKRREDMRALLTPRRRALFSNERSGVVRPESSTFSSGRSTSRGRSRYQICRRVHCRLRRRRRWMRNLIG